MSTKPTLLETLEELAAWVMLPAVPEPRAAAEYSQRLQGAARRLREEMRVAETYCKPHCGLILERINGGPVTP